MLGPVLLTLPEENLADRSIGVGAQVAPPLAIGPWGGVRLLNLTPTAECR